MKKWNLFWVIWSMGFLIMNIVTNGGIGWIITWSILLGWDIGKLVYDTDEKYDY